VEEDRVASGGNNCARGAAAGRFVRFGVCARAASHTDSAQGRRSRVERTSGRQQNSANRACSGGANSSSARCSNADADNSAAARITGSNREARGRRAAHRRARAA